MEALYQWSDVDREVAELSELAQETDLVEHHLGDDSEGNPTMLYALGSLDDPTFLFVTGIHGNELAPREASLRMIRQLSHQGAPDGCCLAWMPTASPSAVRVAYRSPPSHGTDPNGDPYRLRTVEALNLHRALNLARPCAAIDMHETGRDELDVFWGASTMPQVHPEVGRWTSHMSGAVRAATEGVGWTYGQYPSASRITLRKVAEEKHSSMLLTETQMWGARLTRIAQNVSIQRTLVDWFAQHHEAVQESSDRSLHDALHGGDRETFTINRWDTPNPYDVWLTGWQLDNGSSFPPEFIEAFELEVTDDGFVPLRQRSRKCLAFITDDGSVLEPVDTARVSTSPGSPAIGMRVHHDGQKKRVSDAYVMTGGRRRRVLVAARPAESEYDLLMRDAYKVLATTPNIITNGGFERTANTAIGVYAWDRNAGNVGRSGNPRSGQYALRLGAASTDGHPAAAFARPVRAVPGSAFRVVLWSWKTSHGEDTSGDNFQICMRWHHSDGSISHEWGPTRGRLFGVGGWRRWSVDIDVPDDSTIQEARVFFRALPGSGAYQVDDVELYDLTAFKEAEKVALEARHGGGA